LALGVVYGDIGTSPLYAIRECFHGVYGMEPTQANVLGVLSLVFWSLLLIVCVKYLSFIVRADNRGEGGVIALTALISPRGRRPHGGRWVLVAMGLFGASLLYGDGVITPAISVLSAIEGLRTITPVFDPYVVPATGAILIGLFLLQRRGTQGVGSFFGPVTLTWLLVIGLLGIVSLVQRPQVLVAIHPGFGANFLLHNGRAGFLVLGAVFLVLTGTETLYADMGHFGRGPIRRAWFVVVLPMLLCSYFGQGALLLEQPEQAAQPFYAMAPSWFLVPLVALATAATVIASQAVISGAFSLTRQAVQLGYLPRFAIIHTSEQERGQVYIPQLNALLMIATVGLVLVFRSSGMLAAAYGVAVTTTMLITSMLFYTVARERWKWGRLSAGLLVAAFLLVDFTYFAANIGKIAEGAWLPLAIGAAVFLVMTTWNRGRTIVGEKLYGGNPPLESFIQTITADPPLRVPGRVVYMAGSARATPPALLHNLKHNKVLHTQIAIITVLTEEVPRVDRDEKVQIEALGQGFHRVTARFGFTEDPSVPYVLALARERGLDFELDDTIFVIGREQVVAARRSAIWAWRRRLFQFMSRNALDATTFFHIPPNQVVELGAQIEM